MYKKVHRSTSFTLDRVSTCMYMQVHVGVNVGACMMVFIVSSNTVGIL